MSTLEELAPHAAVRGTLPDALVEVVNVQYLRNPLHREPDFGVTSVNYDFAELLALAEIPS